MRQITTLKQYEKEWDLLKQQIQSRPLFVRNSDMEKKRRIATAGQSIWEFGRLYFPEYVPETSAPFHGEWEKLSLMQKKPQQIMAFRGAGKSTFFTFLDPIHAIVYRRASHLLFISYTEDKAAMFTARMLLELLYNKRLHTDFGSFEVPSYNRSLQRFTVNPVKHPYGSSAGVRAVSIGQDPRGLIHGPNRPDYVRCDDIQSDKRARSSAFVLQTVTWLTRSLVPALADQYSYIICSTPLHTRCVASSLELGMQDIPAIKTYKYVAEVRHKATWTELYPTNRLKQIRKTIGTTSYNQEYLLIPTAEDRMFTAEWIRYYDPAILQTIHFDAILSWTDPSAKRKAGDYKATVVAGIADGIIYVLAARVKQESARRMIEAMYRLYEQWQPMYMFWEDNGGQALLEDSFDYLAEEQGHYLPTRSVTNTINKEQRIEQTLSPMIEAGRILFCKNSTDDQALLIDQLLQFPDGAHDDGPDALEGVVRKLQEYARKRKLHLPVTRRPLKSRSVLRGY